MITNTFGSRKGFNKQVGYTTWTRRTKISVRILVGMLIVLMLLPVCSVQAAGNEYDWAVMVYLCGSDLESEDGMASEDLFEMMDAQTNGKACFIVETGGANEWQNETVEADQLERYIVEEESGEYVDGVSNASMGKASTLADFVKWSMENVSADHYGLILWDHGSGSINGVCFDEQYDDDSLSLTEIDTALSGIPKLDFIGFDACLMATYETAAMLSSHADYLIASEETEPGYGWDYEKLGTAMGKGVSAEEIGRIVCDSFYDMCEEIGESDVCTLSVVDLSLIDEVTRSLDIASQAMSSQLSKPEALGIISQGISRAENYGGNNSAEGYTNMVDLGDLLTQVSEAVPEAEDCLKALRRAVVYQRHGSKRSRANGLAIYYPLSVQGSQEMTIFESVNPSKGYVFFVKSMLYGSVTGEIESYVSSGEHVPNLFDLWESFVDSHEEDYAMEITFAEEPYMDEDGWYTFRLDEDCLDYVQSVRLNLGQYLYEDDVYYYLGDDVNVNSDWETGEFWDNFEGIWPSLPDNQELMFFILEETDEYILYSSPILLNDEEMYLRFAFVWDDPDDYENEFGEYVIIDAWDGLDDCGASGRGHVCLSEGDVIAPVYYGFGIDDEEIEEYVGEEYVVDEDFYIEDMQLREGAYEYGFEIIDVWGNSITTDTATFYVTEDGDIEY